MKRANLSYQIIEVLSAEDRQTFRLNNPKVLGFPYVIIDGEPIGGLVETAKFLIQKGLVSAKKG